MRNERFRNVFIKPMQYLEFFCCGDADLRLIIEKSMEKSMLNGAKVHLELHPLILCVLCILKKGRSRDNVSESRVRLE